MKDNLEILRKRRILSRIMTYTMIYTEEYLNTLTLNELIVIQRCSLIELSVKILYKRRHIANIYNSNLNTMPF